MTENNERLLEEFKQVDMICGDMFSCRHGVSQYIGEMERVFSDGQRRVAAWEADYRSLKHIRWLRNQIVHEVAAENCSVDDVAWLQQFHRRLLNRKDPLALLRQAARPAPGARTDRAVGHAARNDAGRSGREVSRPAASPRRTARPQGRKKSGGAGKLLRWGLIAAVLLAALLLLRHCGVLPAWPAAPLP